MVFCYTKCKTQKGGTYMRKDFGAKPYLYPLPVLIIGTYDENGIPDAMNAAWGGICGYKEIIIDLGEHKTTDNIRLHQAFTVSIADQAHLLAADYVGIVSAKDVPDKFEKAGLHAVKSERINAPIIVEFPITLECKLKRITEDGFVGEILNVSVDERVLDESGTIDPLKLNAISFDPVNHAYLLVGAKVGNAFRDGKTLK